MGVFSTLEINPPLYCPFCGEKHTSTQTYDVGYCEYYKVGQKAPLKSHRKNIIMKDEFICGGEDHDRIRCEMFNLGKQTMFPKGNPYNTHPMFCFSCFKDGIYLGTVLDMDSALLLLGNPDEEEVELMVVY